MLKSGIVLTLRRLAYLFSALFSLSFSVLFSFPAIALNESPQTFTLDGTLYQSGTSSVLLDSAAKITVQIINPAGTCLLYEEQQTVNTRDSGGFFSIHVGSATGSAKRTVNDPGRSMAQIFQNVAGFSANHVPGQTCTGGVYTPAAGAVRYFRIIVTPSTTNVADTLTPDIVIDSVPNSLVAQSVQGLERANILQTAVTASTALTQGNLEALFTTPAYTNLQAILGGNFMKTDASGASLPSYASDPAGVSTGDIWFDTTTNEIKYKTAGGVQSVGSSGSGISSLTVGSSLSVNGVVAGTISGSGTIDLSNTGVGAGTYTKVMVDTKGRVTAGTVSLVEGDIPNLTTPGKVSGNTITSGTISGSAGINTSGNLITTGTVSGLTVQATNVRVYNGTNYVQLAAPALGGNVNLTLPATDGNPNEFLKTDGNGVLSWGLATITSSDVTTALGYSPLNAATPFSGDVSGLSNATSVDKIKGKSVTAATISGQIMIYDGTAWVNSVVSGDATLAYDGTLSLNKVPIAKGGTNATSFGNNRIIASNGSGSALVDFSCSLNQVISFDGTGQAVCASVSAISGAILNGGNSTGADISVGTNDNKALNFKTNNTVAMTISQNGNVGIGNINPAIRLHIANNSAGVNGDGIRIDTVTSNNLWYSPVITGRNTTAGGATGTDGILLAIEGQSQASGNGWGDAAKIRLISDGTPSFHNYPGAIQFATSPAGSNFPENRMVIKSTGYVGIGTMTPSTALDVSGAFNMSGMSAPAVSAANQGRIYYDAVANKFKVSQNGAAYTDLVSAGTGTGGIISLGGQAGAAQALAISVDNSVTTPTITSASDTHTWKIPMASNAGTTAGLLNKTDYDSFVAKLGAATIFAGDVSGAYNSTVVQKIQGKSVTAASVSGQIMIYDGTAWVNNVMSGDATLASSGVFTLNTVPVTKGGTNATVFGNNRIIASNGTGTALVDFTCPLNQVITFDVSGNSACANVSSLITALVNGGNTTGGTMSVGANDNHALQFKTNNTIAMTISQNGFVGIGTTAPTGILDVRGGTVGSGNGSTINIIGQAATAGGSTGGHINITGGDGDSYGGNVTISGGAYGGYARSSIVLGGGGWLSNDVTISAGDNNTNGAPGKVTITSGSTANNGGGPLILTTGPGNNSKSGNIFIAPGPSGASGSGNVILGVTSAGTARGMIGVGISTPSTALDVSGAINYVGIAAPGVSSANEGRIYFDRTANKFKVSQNGGAYIDLLGGVSFVNGGNAFSGSAVLGTTDNHSLSIITNNTTAMTISQNGYIGIGTTNPTAPLTVQGGGIAVGDGIISFNKAYPGQVAVGISNTTANYGNIVNMGYGNTVSYANSVAIGRSNNTGNADTSIAIGIGNGATRDNSVLVGNNNSTSASGYYSMLFGRNNSSASQNAVAIGTGNTIAAENASAFGMNIANTISDSVQIGPNNTGKVTITSTGQVGIGTATPSEKLTVSGGNIAAASGQIYSNRQTSSVASPLTFDTNSGNIMVWSTNTSTITANVHNMKPGGTYTLVVAGTGTGVTTINCYSDAGSTSLPSSFVPSNAARTTGTVNKTVYSLLSDGSNCLITWITGF